MSMLMAMFMFYMIGNSIQLITILVTVGFAVPQVAALFRVNEVFQPLEDKQTKDKLLMYKLIYVGLHIVIISAAIYKFSCIIHSQDVTRFSDGTDPGAPDRLVVSGELHPGINRAHAHVSSQATLRRLSKIAENE